MRPSSFFLLPLVLFACKGPERNVASAPVDAPDSAPVTAAAANTPATPQVPSDSVYFQLDRTPCFGSCPAFRVVVKGDGRATYVGQRFAPREGNYTGTLSAAQMTELLTLAEQNGFFGMDDKYDGQVTDLPSTIIRISAGGRTKRVLARVGAPTAFKSFAKAAEGVLEQVQWTRQAGDE